MDTSLINPFPAFVRLGGGAILAHMFSGLTPTYKGILLALTGYSAFAMADACAKWLMQYYSVYQVIAIENMIALVLLLAFAPLLGGMGGLWQKGDRRIHIGRAVLNFFTAALLTYCYKHFALADVYTMIFTKPFFAALLAFWFFGERTSKSQSIAIAIGFLGVLIAMRPGTEGFNLFLLLPLAASTLIAMLFFSTRFLQSPTNFSLGFYPVLGVSVLATPLMMMDFVMPAPAHIPVFILIGVVACLGMVSVSLAFRLTASSIVTPFLYIEMLWALAFGLFIFGDVPDIWMLSGAALIIFGGIFLITSERKNEKPA